MTLGNALWYIFITIAIFPHTIKEVHSANCPSLLRRQVYTVYAEAHERVVLVAVPNKLFYLLHDTIPRCSHPSPKIKYILQTGSALLWVGYKMYAVL